MASFSDLTPDPAADVAPERVWLVGTPLGDARLALASASRPRGLLALGHGAGGGIAAPELAALAAALPGLGVSVLRVEQPWRVAGKRIAPAPARLDLAWRAALDAARESGWLDAELAAPLLVGGRSAGARVACRMAADPAAGVAGVLALAFPLHPPGRPERGRDDELRRVLDARVPLLVAQGERDPFGGPGEFPAQVEVVPIAGADHSFAVARSAGSSQRAAVAAVLAAAVAWLERTAPR